MNIWDKWAERIYAESDIARGVATSTAGATGLVLYFLTSDVAIAGFSALTVFPLARILASSIHRRAIDPTNAIGRIYEKLSPEEVHVTAIFVAAGGSVMTWGQINRSDAAVSAIESLIQRKLIFTSVTADGMTETLVLDQCLFDHANSRGQKEAF